MPALAHQRHLRRRQFALGKSAFLEAEFLMEAEPEIMPHLSLPSKQAPPAGARSPVSVASDIFLPVPMPEIKPMTLPGAWTVIGKGGRPVKNAKMYDEPKKKRVRSRKAKQDQDATLEATLEEGPSSSKCLSTLHHSAVRAEKAAVQGKQLKAWKRSKEAKAQRKMARDILLADMLDAGLLDPDDAPSVPLPPSSSRAAGRHHHMGSRSEKKRRSVRQARQAAKCYGIEEEESTKALLVLSAPEPMRKANSSHRASVAVQDESTSVAREATAAGRMKLRKLGKTTTAARAAAQKAKQCLVM